MKIMVLRAFSFFAAIGLSAGFFAAHAADTNPPPRLTVELRDGSRVVGTSVEKNFKFHSALLGEIKLAVKDIRSVECGSTNSAKLTTVNGDSLTVSFVDSAIAVKTSFGKVELAVNTVRKLTVSASLAASWHPSGLVALWSGEADGKDSAGNNDAELQNIMFADGQIGQAFSFNGVSSTIRIPASPALDLGAGEGFTIMTWIKPSDVQGLHPLFLWPNSDPFQLIVGIGVRPYENGVLASVISDVSGSRFVASHPDVLASGVFQHIALTFDKASGIGTWYLNGTVVARRQLSGQVANTKGDLWISHRDDHPGDWTTGRMFSGLMDEIAIYNRALSAAEIQGICADESHGEPLAKPTSSDGWYQSWMR